MKKLTAFALALVMALGLLSGCGSSNSDSNTPSGDDASDAAAKTKLVVATSPDFPPFESLEGSEVVGIEVDILKKVAEKMGMELDLQQMDFDSVIPGVQAGKFDLGMSGITVTDKRKENVDFSSVYFMAAQAIVVTADSGIIGKADLEGKKVSIQTGTTAEEYCMGNVFDGSFNMDISSTFANQNIYTRPACRECWARFYCSGGCSASNLLVNNDISKSNEVACEMERKRLVCAIALNAIAAGMGEAVPTCSNTDCNQHESCQ